MSEDIASKGVRTTDKNSISYATINRWALVVGVSDYEFGGQGISRLQFAHRDAERFAAKLKTPACGSFPEQNIRLLTNSDACLIQVQRALRSFLAQPKEDDLVIVYFSGHGASDPRRPEQRYFFTYDTDPEDIAGTALPMREIRNCIAETLRAKWVVIIADACHSGALTAARSGTTDAEVLNQFMESLKSSAKSLAWLTSSRANQQSFEKQEFEHGVFTHYLLRGMEGEADGFTDGIKDGTVTIHELFQYVQKKVSEYTHHVQTPTSGPGDFDPNLPLSYTGEIQAQDYFELGRLSMYLGEVLSDPDRFRAASEYFQDSYTLSSGIKKNYKALLLGIRSLVAAGNPDQAMERIGELIYLMESQRGRGQLSEEDLERLSESLYLKGILHLLREEPMDKALECLKNLIGILPGYPRVNTLRELIDMKSAKKSRLFLFLIGVNEYPELGSNSFNGCIHDIEAVEQALSRRWKSIGELHLFKITNAEATKSRIEADFKKIADMAGPLDTFFFHFSGRGGYWNDKDSPVLVTVDKAPEQEKRDGISRKVGKWNSLSVEAFHERMKEVPCIHKFASFDTSSPSKLVTLLEKEPIYNLLCAAYPGEQSYEKLFDGRTYGVFSKAMADALETSSSTSFWQDVLDHVKQNQPNQQPMLIGETGYFFEAAAYSFQSLLKKVYTLGDYLTLSDIRLMEGFFSRIPSFPELQLRLIYLFDRYGQYSLSQTQFLQMEEDKIPSHILPIAVHSSYRNKDHYKSISYIQKLYAHFPKEVTFKTLADKYTALLQMPAHILLIGIDSSQDTPKSRALSVSKGISELARVLQDLALARDARIVVLLNEQATYTKILETYQEMVDKSTDHPVMLYFAGFGKLESPLWLYPKGLELNLPTESPPGVVCCLSADGHLIPLTELDRLTRNGNPENVCAIFDLGSAVEVKNNPMPFDVKKSIPTIGAVSLISGFTEIGKEWAPSCLKPKSGGLLTRKLIKELKRRSQTKFTVNILVDAITETETLQKDCGYLSPRIFGDGKKIFLESAPSLNEEMKTVREFSLRQAREKLSNFTKNEPRAMIELAFVRHLLGDSEGAVQTLEAVEKNIPTQLALGRILVESAGKSKGKWSRAVSELREILDDKNPSTWYYLGKALLGMVYEKEEEEIQILFDKYAVAGFPIGHREEVEAYLNTHNPEKRIPLLLQKAQKLEQEGDLPQALAALHEAAALSSDKAVEEQVRLYEASGKWEQAIATGLPLIDTKRASEELQLKFATLVFYNLAQPKHLESAMQIIEENDLVDILDWMKKYQRFLKQNTITLKTSQ